jgi:hypothetical protein
MEKGRKVDMGRHEGREVKVYEWTMGGRKEGGGK